MFGGLCGVDMYRQSMGRASKISMQGDMRYRPQRVWRDAAGLDPEVNIRKVPYQSWFGRSLITTGGASYTISSYLFKFLVDSSRLLG